MRVYTIRDDRIVYLGEYELVPMPKLEDDIAAIKGSIIAYVLNSNYSSFIGALKDTKEMELIENLAYELHQNIDRTPTLTRYYYLLMKVYGMHGSILSQF
ncbi:hypothetical protein D1T48_gp13 [Thermoproteus tenax virus 1]|uniref:Uncharacterized 11.5 kDa protein n=1 Tax=Thermoproteus tenax virus 1 (strain KRA1) TaxID=10480 RepID=YORB_TTV1K|nr:hypothetical protein D1T48_gp13 [Thermoproteus tenax virus 1]P19286.1 RecName: Full=Uncharacterized 11.5 kDa protein [Thermoproteus tenax virus 1 (STRAIN KRA1)]CAA32980.1 unnamed protein product [Thermoproteus tenax virus 1]